MTLLQSVLFDKFFYKCKNRNYIVHDWKYDSLNNKIIFSENMEETEKIKVLIPEAVNKFVKHGSKYICHIKIIISEEIYKIIIIENRTTDNKTRIYIIDYDLKRFEKVKINDSSYVIPHIQDNMITIKCILTKKTKVYNTDENKFLLFDKDIYNFEKINDRIIYSCDENTLVLYYSAICRNIYIFSLFSFRII